MHHMRMADLSSAARRPQVVEVDTWFPLMFCVTGSGMLVILFFLMRYLIYAIIFLFCIGGTSTMAELGHKRPRQQYGPLAFASLFSGGTCF